MDKERLLRDQRYDRTKIKLAREFRKNMTPAEKYFWERVRKQQFNRLRFRRQQVIDGFIVDFLCAKLRIVVELDGGIHEQRKEYDKARDAVLAKRGLQILRFTNEEVLNNIDRVLKKIGGLSPPQ